MLELVVYTCFHLEGGFVLVFRYFRYYVIQLSLLATLRPFDEAVVINLVCLYLNLYCKIGILIRHWCSFSVNIVV